VSDTGDEVLDLDELEDSFGVHGRPVTVALVHPDASRRSLLERKLARSPGIDLVLASGDHEQAVGEVVERLPDVVALYPDEHLVDTVGRIEHETPAVSVLVLDPGPEHFPALAAGARGTLPSGGSEITRAVLGIARDEAVLTPEWAELLLESIRLVDERVRRLAILTETEKEVLGRLAEGATPREIADEFEVSERLVNLHVGFAVGKYGRACEARRALDVYEPVRDAVPDAAEADAAEADAVDAAEADAVDADG
jgi:DNA-binding NarL/FixJ family response regulator